ncbi:MAG TPA: AMP-binding protein, partial [Ktedonobacterales bacterium]|nr:AMP-binding protein [Ktedonobacterales bacterium]
DDTTRRTYTYGELAATVRRVAGNLARLGFQKGDIFAIYAPNSPEYAITLLAIWSLGGRSLTINPLYTAREMGDQLRDAGARYVLTTPELVARVREAAVPTLKTIFTFGEAADAVPFEPLMTEDANPPEVAINPREDTAVLLYSSGTTGLPKGVMLTHYNVVANICQAQAITRVSDQDTLIASLPFFHIAAWVVLFHLGLYNGGTVVIQSRFDLERFLAALQNYGVTRTLLVPPIVLALAKQPVVDKYDLSKFTALLVGAAPLGENVARMCSERIGCLVQQAYGLSETSPLTHVNPEDAQKLKLGSVGTCLPNTECKVIDIASGEELGIGQQGELWVRGPQVMKGYLNRPEATAATINQEGWLRTGDIGYADEDGHFYIVDRLKEMIKYKAMQVAPAELEAILLSHPAVADVAVIPSPDEEAGEVPKAFVVRRSEVTPEELMAYVAERVAPHKKIRRLEFIETVPKTASGKILRRVLIERERAGAHG